MYYMFPGIYKTLPNSFHLDYQLDWKQEQKIEMPEFLFSEFVAFFNPSKHISKGEILCSP